MTRHLEAIALTRENLMQAFWDLYCQKKIDTITIKEITDKAGYHRSTYYEYFVDIYDLLNQLENEILEQIKADVIYSLNLENKDDFILILANLYETRGKYFSVLLGENGDPRFAKKLKAEMGSTLVRWFGLPENDSHTPYILEFGLSAIMSTITFWYQSGKNIPSKELVTLIRSMLMGGVLPVIQKYSSQSSDPLD